MRARAGFRLPRALSPDVHCAHPGLRSLGGGWRSGILPPLATYAGSQGTGEPEASRFDRLGGWRSGILPALATYAGSQGTGEPEASRFDRL